VNPCPTSDWRPAASLATLKQRAVLLTRIRSFFGERGVLEVETPILGRSMASHPDYRPFQTEFLGMDGSHRRLYLQTSPESAMKRLLAAGSGSIYQITRAFRNSDYGAWHNPEFTILEWYRPGFDHLQLMDEVEGFFDELLASGRADRRAYSDLFHEHLGMDPNNVDRNTLIGLCRKYPSENAALDFQGADCDELLQVLMDACIQPRLPADTLTFVHDFPASQASLARLQPGNPALAERFEAYYGGLELANGYHELTDSEEQRKRFQIELQHRETKGLQSVPQDEHLLAALEAGIPACAGVAVGIDRLAAIQCGASDLTHVIAFPVDRV
jgi:elongation factor P--(R)-beta-lysine ligase